MYESKSQHPLPSAKFAKRLILHLSIALGMVTFSLGIGIVGYCYFEQFSLIDAFLNSAMLLGGMGPVNPPITSEGKLFAGLYALYAGLVFIVTAALIFTPIAHRILHKFHWNVER